MVRHPTLFLTTSKVKGLIGWPTGLLLHKAVLGTRHRLPNILDVGAYKGLSTVYLARAARVTGKRVKTFELFSGLPTVDPVLDADFSLGQFNSQVDEYETNLKTWVVREVVDLVIGDARETMLPEIKDTGFVVAFLDVDVYEVMRVLLLQLWSLVKGGEVIIVHDTNSPGVRKAIDEFHAETGNVTREKRFGSSTSLPLIPKSQPATG